MRSKCYELRESFFKLDEQLPSSHGDSVYKLLANARNYLHPVSNDKL